jgi:hypothetical protein
VAIRGQLDLVHGGDAVAGADLAGVDLVVAEVLVGDVAVLVADEAIDADGVGVHLDLDLRVLRDDLEHAAELLLEHALGLRQHMAAFVRSASLCQGRPAGTLAL